jgi:hypothetical protein
MARLILKLRSRKPVISFPEEVTDVVNRYEGKHQNLNDEIQRSYFISIVPCDT